MGKTWAEKQAEARAKWNARRKAAARGGPVNDVMDIVTQLVGVTNEWSGVGKKKGKKR